MRSRFILDITQKINLIVNIITIWIGLKNIKSLGSNKILLLVPIFSFLQMIISETYLVYKNIEDENFRMSYNYSLIEKEIVDAYVIVEFIIISIFLLNIQKDKKIKKLTRASILISLLTLTYSLYKNYYKNLIPSLEEFTMIEGLTFITFSSYYIISEIKKNSINSISLNPEFLATSGILFCFIILFPNSVLENSFLLNTDDYFNYFFISDSLAYIILFTFLINSFNVSRG